MTKKIFLILMFIILLSPIYFMIIGSFQDTNGVMKMPPQLWPSEITYSNYETIFSWNVQRWVFNSFLVVFFTVFISVFLSCSGGYVFAFYKFRYKELVWTTLLIGIMIPRISFIIPIYVIMNKIGLSGTLAAVVLPIVFSPVGLYLARLYFETVPKSFLESARLDGANELQILLRIVMPVSKPIVTALSVFSAIAALQDYMWQMLVLQNPNRQTLLVGLMREVMLRGGGELSVNPIGKSLAVGTILLFPLVLIFVFSNKYFVSNITGGVKE